MFKHPSRVAQDLLHAPASANLDDDPSSASESSEYETEDSEGDELTPVMDAAILRTLGRIRRGEGVEVGRNVFEEEQAALLAQVSSTLPSDKKKKKEKSMNLSDFQRRALLSSVGKDRTASSSEPTPYTHVQEQAALREEAVKAFGAALGEEENDEGMLFEPSKKGVEEGNDMEDEEYRTFLVGSTGGEKAVREALFGLEQEEKAKQAAAEEAEGEQPKKKKSKKEKKSAEADLAARKQEEETFLLDYILNRGWIDRETVAAPSSATLAAQSKPSKKTKKAADEGSDLSADEGRDGGDEDESEFEDREEEFEVKYNFRFEEPGAEYITTHPRALPSLARREDTTRKSARAAKAERKALEKVQREEEKKKRKAAKRKEIEKKLELLGVGKDGEQVRWDELGLDEEFDDAEHEKRMAELFASGNDFIEGEDTEKPTWDDEDGGQEGYLFGLEDFGVSGDEAPAGEGGEGYEGYEGMEMEDGEAYDGPINMDADAPDDVGTSSRADKKKKKKDKSKKKKGKSAVDDVTEATLGQDVVGELKQLAESGSVESKKRKVDELMDEYDKLDYEDMIGKLPTRFHYAKTTPQNYGLSPAEILMATDEELNTFLGIKQYAAFRSDGGAGAGKVGRDKRLWELKKVLKGRKWGEEPEDPKKKRWGTATDANGEPVKKKRKGKKERSRLAAGEGVTEASAPAEST